MPISIINGRCTEKINFTHEMLQREYEIKQNAAEKRASLKQNRSGKVMMLSGTGGYCYKAKPKSAC